MPGSADSSFSMGLGAQGNINLQGFPYFAFTCLKLFQNLATEMQVIKYTLLECKECFFCSPIFLLFKGKMVGNELVFQDLCPGSC